MGRRSFIDQCCCRQKKTAVCHSDPAPVTIQQAGDSRPQERQGSLLVATALVPTLLWVVLLRVRRVRPAARVRAWISFSKRGASDDERRGATVEFAGGASARCRCDSRAGYAQDWRWPFGRSPSACSGGLARRKKKGRARPGSPFMLHACTRAHVPRSSIWACFAMARPVSPGRRKDRKTILMSEDQLYFFLPSSI